MSKLIPHNSMLSTLGRWPSFWDDEDMQLFAPSASNDVDIYESDKEVVVKANIAGVPSENIDVTFEKGTLWIQAKKEQEEKDKEHKYYSKAAWNYSYKIAVPGELDHNKEPEVTLDHGILKVVFAKSEATQPKKLTIKSK